MVTGCLQSLAEQTFRDFELVVADGAPTDETVAIVESFASRLPRLTLDSCPDRGIYDAMNRAWSRAAGRWLYFIGADDTLRSVDTLQLAAQHLSEGFDVVYGDIVRCTTGRREGASSTSRAWRHGRCATRACSIAGSSSTRSDPTTCAFRSIRTGSSTSAASAGAP
ncbi:MAG: glycosyltransferase [Comamonadaceae bacterium]|nr:glycosyltransferase [Comamonadaceae bacterium]